MRSERVSAVVYILVVLFGIASWIDINGLWMELPILVQSLPEGWSLPSYMVFIIQIANLAPFIYTLTSVRCPRRLPERLVIFTIIGVGVSACVLLVFFWDRTTMVGGKPHSTALLILHFFLALVDTTSSVAFLPFMAIFKPAYMTAYFIGEGFSGLLPALMGLAQGAGRVVCLSITEYNNVTLNGTTSVVINESVRPTYMDINFSIQTFLLFIGAMIVVSGISFTILSYHPRCKREYSAAFRTSDGEGSREVHQLGTYASDEAIQDGYINMLPNLKTDRIAPYDERLTAGMMQDYKMDVEYAVQYCRMSRKEYFTNLVLTGWVNALTNAVLVSVQTYSTLPYGTGPFHLSVTLANVANPLASFLAFFIHVTSVPALCGLTVVGSLLGAYIMAAAAMSPEPVLVGTHAGGAIMVTVWVLCMFSLTYVKVSLASLFRTKGKKGLLYCGAVTQLGSTIGGVTMFVLVNVLGLFVMVYPCT